MPFAWICESAVVTALKVTLWQTLTCKLVVEVDQLPVVNLLEQVLELFAACAFRLVDFREHFVNIRCVLLNAN